MKSLNIGLKTRQAKWMILAASALALGSCAGNNEIRVGQGVGITSTLSACPAVAIPNYTGDITTFSAPTQNSSDIDIVANITNLRSGCNDSGEKLYATASFDVLATRTNPSGARQVTLPYFSTVVRGGSAVIAKRIGTVTLNFADGAYRAQSSGNGAAYIDKAAATLPADIVEKITRKRKSGDPDAAIDPLADPTVRAAINRTSFELLVGFQLTGEQLQYNATR